MDGWVDGRIAVWMVNYCDSKLVAIRRGTNIPQHAAKRHVIPRTIDSGFIIYIQSRTPKPHHYTVKVLSLCCTLLSCTRYYKLTDFSRDFRRTQ
jgi:hypothetical protein